MRQTALLSFLYGRFCAGFHQDGKGAESLAQSNQDIRLSLIHIFILISVILLSIFMLRRISDNIYVMKPKWSIKKEPVSYTHLDVYKRQGNPGSAFGQGCNRTGADRNRKDSSLWYSGCLLYTSRCV